jgi:hypothetical protein
MLHGEADRAQNEVLLEIFKANLDLAKMMSSGASANGGGGAPAPASEPMVVESSVMEPPAIESAASELAGPEPVGAVSEDESPV